MSRIYRRPPLVEALCEFQFAGSDWDWTVPGLMYQEIKQAFPTKRQTQVVEFEVQTEGRQWSQQVKGSAERMQFFRADESALVQVGPHFLAVNHLQPYPHWPSFKPLILDNLDLYRRIANPSGFRRLGLRYVNRIDIPTTQLDLQEYFNFGPRLPAAMTSTPMDALLLRVGLPHQADGGRLLLTLASAPDAEEGNAAFILDLDFIASAASALALDTAHDWIETAHDRIETAFEASISNRLRELFGEIEP